MRTFRGTLAEQESIDVAEDKNGQRATDIYGEDARIRREEIR